MPCLHLLQLPLQQDSTTTLDYTYDSVGNRLTEETQLGTKNYVYDDANRLANVDGVNYTWDANGNLLNDGVNSYTYDSFNRLISVNGTTTYTYNGLGDRLTQNGIQYTLDLNAGLTQVLDDGTNTYTYGLGRISQSGDTTEYFLGDALGSVRQLTAGNGDVTLTKSYAPYGEVMSTSGNGTSPFAYTGEAMDESTGLTYLRARYYNGTDGRFMSRDTWAGNYNSPLSLNRWNYTHSNPLVYTDPSGHCIDGVTTAVCFMILAGIAAGVALVVTDQYNGDSPDILGIGNVVVNGPHQDNSAITTYTAAGIAVQSNWKPLTDIFNPFDYKNAGLGRAQVSVNQANGTDPNKGQLNMPGTGVLDLFDPNVSNQAMEKRISQVLIVCNKEGKITCSQTDIFLAASQAQNSGFFIGSMRDLVNSKNALDFDPNNPTQALLPWGEWFNNPIRKRNDPAAATYDRFMVKLFSNDVKELGCLGWYVPPDLNWDYINSWTAGASRSK